MANNSESYPFKQWVAFLYIAVAGNGLNNYSMKNYTLVLMIALFISACSSSKQFHQAPSVSFKLPKKLSKNGNILYH
jgi:hypothetical protein